MKNSPKHFRQPPLTLGQYHYWFSNMWKHSLVYREQHFWPVGVYRASLEEKWINMWVISNSLCNSYIWPVILDFPFLFSSSDVIHQKIKYEPKRLRFSWGRNVLDGCMYVHFTVHCCLYFKYLHNSKNRQPPGYLLLPVGRGKPTAQLSKHQNSDENLRRIRLQNWQLELWASTN